jgi:hypothetical protein
MFPGVRNFHYNLSFRFGTCGFLLDPLNWHSRANAASQHCHAYGLSARRKKEDRQFGVANV